MNTNTLIALGFRKDVANDYIRDFEMMGQKVVVCIQKSPVCDTDWGISFNYEEIYEIGDEDEIMDFIVTHMNQMHDNILAK